MAGAWTRSRCVERLDALAGSACDADALRLEAIAELRRAIGFDRWCALLVDPASLLVSRGMGDNDWTRELPQLNLHAGAGAEVNDLAALARGPDPVGVLSVATGGDLARSRRWRDVLAPYGAGDELSAAVADEYGCWADLHLWRSSDDRAFDAEDVRLMRTASRVLARGFRRASVAAAGARREIPDDVGVLLLDAALRPAGATSAADAWFAALNPAGTPFPDGIPNVVWAVAGRLDAGDADGPPRVRVPVGDGRWAIVEAARLQGDAAGPVAVTIRRATPEEVLGLVGLAHGLTARERELVGLVVEGLDTVALAQRLGISRHTVQDHLKSIFAKVGVRSRRELAAALLGRAE